MKNIFIITIFIIAGCSYQERRHDDPVLVLRDYIASSFAIKSYKDKRYMLSYLKGDALKKLKALSSAEFNEQFVNQRRTFLKLKILSEEKLNKDKFKIQYELSYINLPESNNPISTENKVTNRKSATIIKKDNKWYINEVKNVTQLIEFKDEMTIP